MRILAIDIDTRSVKAAVLDVSSGTLVGPCGQAAYALDQPTADAAEVPAERLWLAITAATRAAAGTVEGLEGIGLSCTTPALVLLDQADRPLMPIWTHLDRRSRTAARQVSAAVGDEFLASVGSRPLPGGISAICWRQLLVDNPYLGHKVRSYLHLNGWLGLRLTGTHAFDRANACATGLYGTLTDQRWSERWCEFFQVDPSWLPPVLCGSTTVGTLRSAAAAELGVPAGLPVKLGTADTSSALLAARLQPGDVLQVVGTTQVLATLAATPRPSSKRLTRQLGVGDPFIYLTHNPVGSAALDWLRRLCFQDQDERQFHEQTVPAALARTTRVTLDPPHLAGDRLEIEAHRAAFRDLTLATDRFDLLAAVLATMRRCQREALENLGTVGGRVFLTGVDAEGMPSILFDPANAAVERVEDAALHGVARLFESPPS